MDGFVEVVAVVGLSGVIAMTVISPLLAAAMGGAILVGLIDGPTGGRWEARSTAAAGRVTPGIPTQEPSPDGGTTA